jgi:uncharacterized protein YdhG (YjbR/CyaY superfamily)
MRTPAKDPDSYVAGLSPDRRVEVEKLRALVKKAVPKATEGILWGMLGYAFNDRPFAGIASHKSYISLYLMDLYTQPGLRDKHAKGLATLKMGKSCINIQSFDKLPLDTIVAILKIAPTARVEGGTMSGTKR